MVGLMVGDWQRTMSLGPALVTEALQHAKALDQLMILPHVVAGLAQSIA
jgi:hypothetical protein